MSGGTLLFTGDSVTAAGRDRARPRSLGEGWVRMVADRLDPASHEVINRGVGGERTEDVERRWARDCLRDTPAVVTLMVGINDVWRAFDSDDPRPLDAYRGALLRMVESARRRRVDVVLVEPFALRCGVVTREWWDELAPRQAVVAEVATQTNARFVATQARFDLEASERGAAALVPDGVHPSEAGHRVLAELWWNACSATLGDREMR